MSKLSYWERRKAQLVIDQMDKAEQFADELELAYRQAMRYFQGRTDKIFDKFQRDYGLTEAQARQLLKQAPRLDNVQDLKRILEAQPNDPNITQLLADLDSPAYAFRLERLQRMREEMQEAVRNIARQEQERSRDFYGELADDSFHRATFELQQRSGLGYSFQSPLKAEISALLRSQWQGSNYSSRIWKNAESLSQGLKKELLIGLLAGKSDREVAEAIEQRFGAGKYNSRRLVRTESAFFHGQMELKSYQEADVEYYRFVAVLDLRTSEKCQGQDGKIRLVSEAVEGVTYPPLHPWCRSTTIAADDREWLSKLERRARDPETGKTTLVPGDMTYKEWYAKYVEEPKERELSGREFGVDLDYVRSDEYLDKIRRHPLTEDIADSIAKSSRQILQHRNGTEFEDYHLLNTSSGKVVAISNKARVPKKVVYNEQVRKAFKTSAEKTLVSIHNHPSGYPPSLSDLASLQQKSKNNTVKYGITAGHDGSIYWYTRPNKRIPRNAEQEYLNSIEKFMKLGYTDVKAQEETLKMLSEKFGFEFGRIE